MKTCEDCGEVSTEVDNINCPYDEKFNDKITLINVCDDCYDCRCLKKE